MLSGVAGQVVEFTLMTRILGFDDPEQDQGFLCLSILKRLQGVQFWQRGFGSGLGKTFPVETLA